MKFRGKCLGWNYIGGVDNSKWSLRSFISFLFLFFFWRNRKILGILDLWFIEQIFWCLWSLFRGEIFLKYSLIGYFEEIVYSISMKQIFVKSSLISNIVQFRNLLHIYIVNVIKVGLLLLYSQHKKKDFTSSIYLFHHPLRLMDRYHFCTRNFVPSSSIFTLSVIVVMMKIWIHIFKEMVFIYELKKRCYRP